MGAKHMQITRQRGFISGLLLLGYIVAAVAVGSVIWAAWHTFTESYRDEGREEVLADWAALIGECEKSKALGRTTKGTAHTCAESWRASVSNAKQSEDNLAGCQRASREQSDAVTAAEKQAADARAATRDILAEIAKRAKATQAEVEKLRQIAATPAPTRKVACDEADSLLSTLAARRMRWNPDGPVPGGGSANDHGPSSGSGGVLIRP